MATDVSFRTSAMKDEIGGGEILCRVGSLGYIVRRDYPLVRRRVIN